MNKEDYDILEMSTHYPIRRLEGIDYKLFEYKNRWVFYICESNEPSDWAWNILGYTGIMYHAGFFVKAKLFEKMVEKRMEKIILCGHSHGAGIASILTNLISNKIERTILTGCPMSYTWINPKQPKNTTLYEIKGDVISKSGMLYWGFRRPKKPIILEHDGKGIAENHVLKSYIHAMIACNK